MRKIKILPLLLIVAFSFLDVPTYAKPCFIDEIVIDIGDLSSESQPAVLYMAGWGPIEPATSGGWYGGVDNCRVTWAPDEVAGVGPLTKPLSSYPIPDEAAVIVVATGRLGGLRRGIKITLRVLDGIADDSFTVYLIYKIGKRWRTYKLYHYDWSGNPSEFWLDHEITLPINPCILFLMIRADGEKWSGWDRWGQLAIDKITITRA